MKKFSAIAKTFFASACALFFLNAYAGSQTTTTATNTQNENIIQLAATNPQLSTFVSAVNAAGLTATLQGKGPYTVFAPNNAAFAKLPKGALSALLANKSQLNTVLTYHVVPDALMTAQLTNGTVKTLAGQTVSISLKNGGVYINNARAIIADVQASNGVIYVINSVLTPSTSTKK